MRNITTFILIIYSLSGFGQNGGSTCGTAVSITPGSFTATAISVGTNGGEMGTSQPRSSAWFTFTPAEDGTVDVSSCLGGRDTRVYIGTGTCGSLSVLASNDDACPDGTSDFDYASSVSGVALTAGVTYYIEWDNRWDAGPFDWTLTFDAAPACSEITNPVADLLLDTSIDFSWDGAAFGPAAGYSWEIVSAGTGQGTNVIASGNTTGTSASSGDVLTANTDYDLFIQTDCGVNGSSAWVGPLGFTTLNFTPVSNDLCVGAITLTIEGNVADAASATYTSGSVANTANTNIAAFECNGFTGNALDDVWYAFVASSADVNITVDTNFDAVLNLFSGDCNNLSVLECADDSFTSTGGIEEINASGLTVGQTYYFRVYSYGETPPANAAFEVALWTPQTLSNSEVLANAEFIYYPNPVSDLLTIRAQNSIERINMINVMGQTVLEIRPNTVETDIDMQALGSGTYFAQVTIAGVTNIIKVLKP
jgi:hypothetical protein